MNDTYEIGRYRYICSNKYIFLANNEHKSMILYAACFFWLPKTKNCYFTFFNHQIIYGKNEKATWIVMRLVLKSLKIKISEFFVNFDFFLQKRLIR